MVLILWTCEECDRREELLVADRSPDECVRRWLGKVSSAVAHRHAIASLLCESKCVAASVPANPLGVGFPAGSESEAAVTAEVSP